MKGRSSFKQELDSSLYLHMGLRRGYMGSPIIRDLQEPKKWQSTSGRAATLYPNISGRGREHKDYDQTLPRYYDLNNGISVWNTNSAAKRDNITSFSSLLLVLVVAVWRLFSSGVFLLREVERIIPR